MWQCRLLQLRLCESFDKLLQRNLQFLFAICIVVSAKVPTSFNTLQFVLKRVVNEWYWNIYWLCGWCCSYHRCCGRSGRMMLNLLKMEVWIAIIQHFSTELLTSYFLSSVCWLYSARSAEVFIWEGMNKNSLFGRLFVKLSGQFTIFSHSNIDV